MRTTWLGCFYKLGVPLKWGGVLALIDGRFRADPYENYMAVSMNWGVLLKGVIGLL